LNILVSDKNEHKVTKVASADSEINILVSAAFFNKAGRI